MDYRDDCFEILRDFLSYHETIKGHSKNTVDEYYLDLRNFFRYIKIIKNKYIKLIYHIYCFNVRMQFYYRRSIIIIYFIIK